MTVLLVVLGVIVAWSLLTFPVAVAIGRAFRAGEGGASEAVVRDYDVARV